MRVKRLKIKVEKEELNGLELLRELKWSSKAVERLEWESTLLRQTIEGFGTVLIGTLVLLQGISSKA